MKLFRWEQGRQGGQYWKMLLAWGQSFDFYLLKFGRDQAVPVHRDPVKPGFAHYRLNVTIKRPLIGGRVTVVGPSRQYLNGRIMFFRPDLYDHGMTGPEYIWPDSFMYMLSFGFVRRKDA